MKMNDEQIQAVGAALYQVLGQHDASEEALDLALALAQDTVITTDPTGLTPYVTPYPDPKDFADAAAIQRYLRAAAKHLIESAHCLGAKVEIALDSPAPYAMGSHVERIEIRAIPDNSIEDPRSRRAF
jgi:hypothetical protein